MKILLIVLIAVAALLTAGGIYFKYKITPILKSQLNKQLKVKVDVQEVSLSKLADFPKIGIRFSNILIVESQKYYEKPLLKAKELNLFVDIFKLWKKEYVVDQINISSGELHLADLYGGSNYDILKEDTSENQESISFEIEKLELIDMDVDYRHVPSDFTSNGFFNKVNAKILYTDSGTDLRIQGTLLAHEISQSGEKYLNNQHVEVNTEIILRDNYESISISPSDLMVEKVNLNAKGLIVSKKDWTSIDIKFDNDKAPLNDLVSIIPESIQESFAHLDLKGDAMIKGFFKGKIDHDHNPSFGFTFNILDGAVKVKDQALAFDNIQAQGDLNIPNVGNMASASVNCKFQRARSGNNSIDGQLSIRNFDRPAISWNGNANIDAATALAFADNSNIKLSAGRLNFTGKVAMTIDLEKGEPLPNTFIYEGSLRGSGIKGKIKEPSLDLKSFNFDLSANNNKMAIKSCKIQYNNTSADLIGYILHSNEIFSTNSRTEITGQLNIRDLYINEIYVEQGEGSDAITGPLFPYFLNLQTELTNFRYNDFIAHKMTGTLKSNKLSFSMDDCKIAAVEGNTDASLKFSKMGENYLLDVNSKLAGINIRELFKQFNNFEQQEITSDHISGVLTGAIHAKVIMDNHYEPIMDKLYAKIEIEITDGQLVGYAPLRELSNYIELEDLEDVKFSSLKNTIEIFDETIFIPKMYIGNNALSMEIEGTHNFDNYMRYSMSISVVELLAKKSNWIAKKKEKRIEENEQGGLTAHILMEGTPDDLKISYDKVKLKETVNEEIKKEKKTFIQALKGDLPEEQDQTNYDDVWDE